MVLRRFGMDEAVQSLMCAVARMCALVTHWRQHKTLLVEYPEKLHLQRGLHEQYSNVLTCNHLVFTLSYSVSLHLTVGALSGGACSGS